MAGTSPAMTKAEGDSPVECSRATWKDTEADTMRRLGQDSIVPHRVKYKKLSR
jgi:hypothetical protein